MNILMVLADQHNATQLGCAGHAQALTPNFDRLAANGVRFTRAYAQNTICTPSRVSILSGQYCHNHGYYALSGPANFGVPNLMRHCRAHGYRTAAYGKLHLPNRPRNWLADDLEEFGDSYENIDGVIGTSEFLAGLERDGLRDLEDSWHNFSGAYGKSSLLGNDATASRLPYERTQEVWCARKAMAFIDREPEKPFCIQIAFQKPHHPLLPQQRFLDLYPEDIDLPPTYDHEPGGRPPHFRRMWEAAREYEWPCARPGEDASAGPRRAWRATLACVSQIDDVLGMLLDYLDAKGLADDTIVIYGGDHGGYHTVHGILEKAPGICSDAVCRVPMIWRVPGLTPRGHVCDALAENVDLAPTLARLCGLPELDSADGADLTPLLRGEDTAVHPHAVTENAWSKAIRWDRWRLVHYPAGMFGDKPTGELYDMAEDPDETRNRYNDPACAEVVREGRARLLDWLIATSRVTTSQPAVYEGERFGARTYPLCTDGRAPNPIQPRNRQERELNYL